MLADGFATTINVMGPEKGYSFAIKENLPIYMIIRNVYNLFSYIISLQWLPMNWSRPLFNEDDMSEMESSRVGVQSMRPPPRVLF